LNMAVEGCKQISQLQKEALKAKYVHAQETTADKEEETEEEATEQ